MTNTKLIKNLLVAPILGFAFVIFLPLIGFLMCFYAIGNKFCK